IPVDGVFTSQILPGEHEIAVQKDGFFQKNIKQQFGVGTTVIDAGLTPDLEFRDWAAIKDSHVSSEFKRFLAQYPNSKYAPQARSALEQTRWNELKDSSDEEQLDEFARVYPNSQYSSAARARMATLVQEDEDWH